MNNIKPKILIVDDERFYINILVELLSQDYDTVVTKDGAQAIDRALELPDLILLDIMMPDMDGYEVCRQLKADKRTRDIPVIFLTIKSELDDEIHGFELGAVDYIAKPISPAIVKARVATHITLNHALKNLAQQNNDLLIEQSKKDEQLRRSQKLEALGKLTGGIAHDFNNILGIVLGYANLIQCDIGNDKKLDNYVKQILSAGERGSKITQKLLSFSRKKPSQEKAVNINHVLEEHQHMLQKSLTVSVTLNFEMEKNIWNICLNKSDLEDAILNMCINAKHAMPEGGTLILKTNKKFLSSKSANSLHIPSGEYVLLSLIDNGIGMDQQTMSKIFDPFFTTKGDQGTGLGMSQVYGFIERSSGTIHVHSVLGRGTHITLYFPRSTQKQLQVSDEFSSSNDYTGNEIILIVDDEEALRNLMGELLKRQGYSILYADNAEKALEILATETVDLLLSDVIMPGMNGYEFALTVQKSYPHIKIQIMSGFDDNNFKNGAYEKLHRQCLKKPVQTTKLLERIRNLLEYKH